MEEKIKNSLTKKEAAKLIGVTTKTIDNWREKGLDSFNVGKIIRIEKEVLFAFIQNNQN